MIEPSKAFEKIAGCGGDSMVDNAVDTDWPSIETVLAEYAEREGADWQSFFRQALDDYSATADQARNQDGYRPSFNFSVLIGDPGTAQVRWR